MLKYVHLIGPLGDLFVFTLPPLKSSELVVPFISAGYQAVSAGFVHFGPACGITTHGESVSLNLKPHADDALMIACLYDHTGTGVREITAPRRPAAHVLSSV